MGEPVNTDPISLVEDAMVAAIAAALPNKLRKVETVPAALSADEWAARLKVAPAVYVGFLGGPAGPSFQARIKGRFMVYVVTGTPGTNELQRRRGTVSTIGAYAILAIAIPVLAGLNVSGVGSLEFTGEVANLFSETFDRLGVSVYAAEFDVGLSFDYTPDLSQYEDFATFDGDIVIERPLPTDGIPLPAGEAAVESRVTLPNS